MFCRGLCRRPRWRRTLEQFSIVYDLALTLGIALIGGFTAHRLRQPVMVGYLVGGMLVGPFGLGLVRNLEQVQTLAEIGVVLLMFALGVEFSLGELKEVRRVAVLGGPIQIIATTALVALGGALLALPIPQAVFFGGLVALSSTMIVLKTLMERGELDSIHGRVLIGLLIVQDLSVIPLMIVLPALGSPRPDLLTALGLSVFEAAVILGAILLIGSRVIPRLMSKVAETKSHELFLLTVITLCLGAAFGVAFLGLTVSESVFGQQVLADIIPLRNTFATLFFASIGMLTDPRFIYDNAPMVLLIVVAVVLGKFVISAAVSYGFRYSLKTCLLVGAGMVQIGEFSFVMANEGVKAGIISEYLYALTLATAIITIIITPFALSATSSVFLPISRTHFWRRLIQVRTEPALPEREIRLVNHVVICGFGRVGNELARVLDRREFAYFVIDYDPHVIVELRKKGIPSIYGDASNPVVLSFAQLERAKVMVVTMSDSVTARLVVNAAAAINPKLDIIARVETESGLEFLRRTPAREFVHPEFEASLEIVRHTLHRFGVTSLEIQYLLNTLRHDYYETR